MNNIGFKVEKSQLLTFIYNFEAFYLMKAYQIYLNLLDIFRD